MKIIQKISTKIVDLLSSETPKSQNTDETAMADSDESVKESNGKNVEEKPKTRPLPNSVEVRGQIKKSTLSLLNSLYFANPEECPKKSLIVWLDTDTITFNSFSGFGQELENYWDVESGYEFKTVELRQGRPENEKDARKIEVGIASIAIYLQEKKRGFEKSTVKMARISVFGGNGSLLQEQYELSSEMLEKEHRKYYNIGRGEYPNMDGGSYRQNHIAIDDENNLETNKYVSRAHAHIGYAEIIGFYLQVEFGGSRLSGNRTRIIRGENKIEVENVEVKEPLHDGDLIELGKAVVLQFIEIK